MHKTRTELLLLVIWFTMHDIMASKERPIKLAVAELQDLEEVRA